MIVLSLQTMFFLPFGITFLLLKSYMLHRVIDTEVNRISVQGFILIWLGIGLCLVLSIALGACSVLFLSPFLTLGFLKNSSLQRVCVLKLL